jgi:hypothetical protein
MSRVVLGGLLAGLIINISEFILNGVVFAEEMTAAMASLNRPPIADSMIVWFVLFGFGLGIVSIWLYAAIRPRYGPGVRTALCAGLAIWGLAYLYPTLFFLAMKLFPTRLTVISTVWGLAEVLIAAVAGAAIYKET